MHNYNENSTSTDVLFSDAKFVVAEIVIYGIYKDNSTKMEQEIQHEIKEGKSNKEMKIVLVNPKKAPIY